MNYKEKYNEALARAKEQLNGAKVFNYDNEQVAHNIRTTVYNIFPKLKESESKDERIRKKLIELFHDTVSNDEIFSDYGLDKTEVLDWLEKQGNNADKVEPKFKVGNWVVENEPNNYARFIQILEIVNVQGKDRYRISRDIHNDEDIVDFDFVEKYYHKFDIKDAKDGDVLCLGDVIAIFKKHIGKEECICYCSFCDVGDFEIPIENGEDNIYGCTNTTPATKEQRDTLEKAMANAGYKWDVNKKELIKL